MHVLSQNLKDHFITLRIYDMDLVTSYNFNNWRKFTKVDDTFDIETFVIQAGFRRRLIRKIISSQTDRHTDRLKTWDFLPLGTMRGVVRALTTASLGGVEATLTATRPQNQSGLEGEFSQRGNERLIYHTSLEEARKGNRNVEHIISLLVGWFVKYFATKIASECP